MPASLVVHDHNPVYRVVRRAWKDPLDASYSRRRNADNRWNTPSFGALYCCCSPVVARGVANDILRVASTDLADLQDTAYPQLVEIEWSGTVVDMASAEGILAAGFPDSYPGGVAKAATRRAASAWHRRKFQGIVCRSASLARLGRKTWTGSHEPWGELAIFPRNAAAPKLVRRRSDLIWLEPPGLVEF